MVLSDARSGFGEGTDLKRAAKFLRKLRGLSFVHRWNFHPRVRQENVAEHSFWVAVIAYQLGLLKELEPRDFIRLLVEALFHDREEAITSDLPALVKTGNSWDDVEGRARLELGLEEHFLGDEAPNHIKLIVKLSDRIAAYMYANEEVQLGNTCFEQIRGELITSAWRIADADIEFKRFLNVIGMMKSKARKPIKEISHL